MNKPKPGASEWVRVRTYAGAALTEHLFQIFEKSAASNPFCYWQAIYICIKEKREFPPWVIAYLERVAGRMRMECYGERNGAKRPGNVANTLLRILEFQKKKMGPGKLLDRFEESVLAGWKYHFALEFAERLHKVGKLSDARGDAGFAAFKKDVTDRILKKYLREEFRVNKLPSTIEEWEPVIRRYRDDVKAGKRTFWTDNR